MSEPLRIEGWECIEAVVEDWEHDPSRLIPVRRTYFRDRHSRASWGFHRHLNGEMVAESYCADPEPVLVTIPASVTAWLMRPWEASNG